LVASVSSGLAMISSSWFLMGRGDNTSSVQCAQVQSDNLSQGS
jgi:hypothetical protein